MEKWLQCVHCFVFYLKAFFTTQTTRQQKQPKSNCFCSVIWSLIVILTQKGWEQFVFYKWWNGQLFFGMLVHRFCAPTFGTTNGKRFWIVTSRGATHSPTSFLVSFLARRYSFLSPHNSQQNSSEHWEIEQKKPSVFWKTWAWIVLRRCRRHSSRELNEIWKQKFFWPMTNGPRWPEQKKFLRWGTSYGLRVWIWRATNSPKNFSNQIRLEDRQIVFLKKLEKQNILFYFMPLFKKNGQKKSFKSHYSAIGFEGVE